MKDTNYIDLVIQLGKMGYKNIRPNLLLFPCKETFDMWNDFFGNKVCIISRSKVKFPILLLHTHDDCWESVNFNELKGD